MVIRFGASCFQRRRRAMGGLPIGLAHGVVLNANTAAGQPITWNDVEIDEAAAAVKIRCEMEQRFA